MTWLVQGGTEELTAVAVPLAWGHGWVLGSSSPEPVPLALPPNPAVDLGRSRPSAGLETESQ